MPPWSSLEKLSEGSAPRTPFAWNSRTGDGARRQMLTGAPNRGAPEENHEKTSRLVASTYGSGNAPFGRTAWPRAARATPRQPGPSAATPFGAERPGRTAG